MTIYNAPIYQDNLIDPNTFKLPNGETPVFYSVDEASVKSEVSRTSIYYHVHDSKKLRGYVKYGEKTSKKWYVLWQDILVVYKKTAAGKKQKQGIDSNEPDNSELIDVLTKYFNEISKFEWVTKSADDVRHFLADEIKRLSV